MTCLGSGIPSLVGFEGYKKNVVRVHLSRPVQVQGKGDRGDPDFRSLLYGGRFISYQECVGEARERRIGSRGDAYYTCYHSTTKPGAEGGT